MATPLLLMASGQTTTEEAKPKSTKARRRKPAKVPTPRKQPQRGLGVAQLERLRLQERWKKITQMPHAQAVSLPDIQRQRQTPTVPVPFTDPAGSAAVQYGPPLYVAPSMVANGCGSLMIQRMGNGGGRGGLCYGGSSWVRGTLVVPDQPAMDPYAGVGAPDPRVLLGTVYEASKELSSIPKIHSRRQRCGVCFKNKPDDGSDFVGANLKNSSNFIGETSQFGARAARCGGRKTDEGAGVVAVHRNRSSRGGSVLMEYEFFPEKTGRGTSSKALELPTEASVAVGSEASTPTTAYISTPTSVDLSLRLSS